MAWTLRSAMPADQERIISVIDDWWGGRSMAGLLQPLFLENFSSTSLVAEGSNGELIGFLVGFVSGDDPNTAYAHFVGVAPAERGKGLGAALYEQFANDVARRGVRRIRCVTAVVNEASVAFHEAMGFQVTGRTVEPSADGGGYVQMERPVVAEDGTPAGEAMWPLSSDRVLSGHYLQARPTRPNDAPDLFRALDHSVVWQHLTWPRPTSVDEMADLVAQAIDSMSPWTLTLLRDVNGVPPGTVVGWSSYLEVSVRDARLEVGATSYNPRVWGSTVNPEAKLLLLGLAFDDLGFGRVQLKTDVRNERSQDAIARLGARREGVLRSFQRRTDGTVRDTVLYSITADEWPGVRANLERRINA